MPAGAVYLDYAATTPVDPAVAQEMAACLLADGAFGNPASSHAPGQAAALRVRQARAEVAALIGAQPEEIIWTSGATEANNLAIIGAARFHRRRGNHLITVRTEHKSVLAAFAALEKEGFEVDYLMPEPDGTLAAETLEAALRDDTVLVSAMYVNNELGSVNDIQALAQVVKARDALFHIDAVQAVGRLPLDLTELPADLVSMSAHKLYGPKGVGALYVRRRPRVRLSPLLHGGEQEQGLRSGTVPTHQVAGMGAAFRIAAARREHDFRQVGALKQRLMGGLQQLDGVVLNGQQTGAPHILNVSFVGVHGEALAAELEELAVASGSACSSASASPSHVLRAIGRPDPLAHASIRLSIGRFSTEQEIDRAVETIEGAVRRLRRFSPVWHAYQHGTSLTELYAADV